MRQRKLDKSTFGALTPFLGVGLIIGFGGSGIVFSSTCFLAGSGGGSEKR
jgi:hypothetical protein